MKKRHLISDDNIIVVFDTSPIRNLAHNKDIPSWVNIFVDMKKDGYFFCISDAAAAELLTQVRSGRIPLEGYARMINALERFIDQNIPVLPGSIDLEAIVGIHDEPNFLEETLFLSKEAWRQLRNPHDPYTSLGPPLEQLLEEERVYWTTSLQSMVVGSISMGIDIASTDPDEAAEYLANMFGNKIYPNCNIEPPMEIRKHLELRYRFRQMARSAQKKMPYNPNSKRNKNDGIDVDQYKYFILPAFVIAEDSGFFESLQGINSFQTAWFIKPNDLANRWLAGERPIPIWPDITN